MKTKANDRTKKCACMAITLIVFMTAFGEFAFGYSKQMRRVFVQGPWELMVTTGQQGNDLVFPVTVSDEDKPEKLNSVLPIMGTAMEIRLERYLPAFKWENSIEKKTGGGLIAQLIIKGKGMHQEMLLNSKDPAKKSISSAIGGITLKKVRDPNNLTKLLGGLKSKKAVGIVSVWLEGADSPLEYVANINEAITVAKTKYKLRIEKYIPHYSIDRKTKEVASISTRPVNPAIKIKLSDDDNSYEKWIWSKIDMSPHDKVKLPLRIEFEEFDIGDEEGKYILAAAEDSQGWLIFSDGQKTVTEKVDPNKSYLFADQGYYFNIGQVVTNAIIKTSWKNESDKLLSPAVIARIQMGQKEREIILELGKPVHRGTEFGTMIFSFQQKQTAHSIKPK